MIETIKKSVGKEGIKQKIRDELSWNGFDEEVIEPIFQIFLTAHLTLLEDLIKREEGEMKDWLSKFMLNHQEENDEWGNGYANAYKEAKTDTITTLQALREEINKMI